MLENNEAQEMDNIFSPKMEIILFGEVDDPITTSGGIDDGDED